ncbi:MAG: YitT family protein [Prevotellaceae bacterium]|jgi:uncharacterized membrane-anchored protein YitT (DUF2179 family)|nr:YitT family protein [Prevotellaceae bacterium]
MKQKSAKKTRSIIKSYIFISLGMFIYVTGWVAFLMPNHLVGGGVSGIAALVQYATGFPLSYTYFIINAFLLLLALKILGRGFGAKTVYAVALTTVLFRVLPAIIPADLIADLSENGKLISALIGGVLTGAGIGLIFNQGGSSGGTDIVALIINKYRNISPGRIILSIDMVIIGCSFFVSGEPTLGKQLATVLYGYIVVSVTGYTIDMILSGARQSQQFFVFSKHYETIARRITTEMNRGVTIIDGQGWYSKNEQKIVMIIARKSESNGIYHIIKDVDKEAFLSVGNVMGVYGKGFEQIRTK